MTDCAGLLLAAGEGKRLGGPKALVEVDGELLVDRAARMLADGGCSPVGGVLGAAAPEGTARAGLADALVVGNDGWAPGGGAPFGGGLTGRGGAGAGRAGGALGGQ